MKLELNKRALLQLVAGGLTFAALATSGAEAQETKLRLSHHLAPGHLVDVASHRFADLVSEYTDGAVSVEVFPSGQIAGLRQGAEAVQLGTVDFVWTDMGTLGNWRPEYGFVSLPFLFSGNEHFAAFFDGEGGEKVAESLRRNLNIEVLGFGNAGFRVVATRETPVREPADLKGVRIRVPEIPIYISAFKSVGANPTPLAWGEVYTAMQTGVIDAVENPAEGLVNGALNEVAHHISKTNHIMTDVNLFANAGKFDALDAGEQDAIHRAAETALAEFNDATAEASDEYWAQLAETMEAIDDPDRPAFQKAMAPVWDEFVARAGEPGQAWIDLVVAADPT
ncbi:TRAP transporter substrate-binding protein [Martelella soudanensis]|uniref:TRAP transporter substrate-binding protein n=1 Tax=unclassified Martelella TaxID=2629616 RepID=UPI0015DE5E11|nr:MULTISPECIES: TRAP transporter substrate-binding protein [unclassified Martelella]